VATRVATPDIIGGALAHPIGPVPSMSARINIFAERLILLSNTTVSRFMVAAQGSIIIL